MAKVGFISLGCAKNQVDCERMVHLVREAGHTIQMELEGTDVVVINTCGFIDTAKREAIDIILQMATLKDEKQVGKILVTGCLSQRYQQELLDEMPEVDGVLGTGSYHQVVSAIEKLVAGESVAEFGPIDAPETHTKRVLSTPPHYAYIKIAEGCDNHCAYCVIPSLRGKYRSRPMDELLAEAKGLAATGVRELIVVAQDTCRYGTDLPGKQRLLPELLRQFCQIEGIEWVRLHYAYPDQISDELIDVMATEPKIVHYMDVPIQHCNDKILKLMNRRGTKEELKTLFAKLRQRMPDIVIRTSIISGLPGEGEEEFEELFAFLKELRLERVGVFPFSPEEGTPAAEMDHVDEDVAYERLHSLEYLQYQIMEEHNQSMIGKTLKVIVDNYEEEFQLYSGRSYGESPDVDGKVWIASDEPIGIGAFVNICIDNVVEGELCGYVLEE